MTTGASQLAAAVTAVGKHRVYYTRKFGYFLAFLDFVPRVTEMRTGQPVPPSELKDLCFPDASTALAVVSALSSTTFFWFWNVLSDCRNVNRRDILAFPINLKSEPEAIKTQLAELGRKYIKALKSSSYEMQKSGLQIQTFEYGSTKHILDEIDSVLAEYYKFTSEELDFITNYDIKYRLGRGGDEGDE